MPDASLPPLPPAGQPRWRTSLDEKLRLVPVPPRVLIATAGAALLVLGAGLVLVRVTRPVAVVAAPAPAVSVVPPVSTSTVTRPTGRDADVVVVDVTGAVVHPGLVRLSVGTRVADAVAAAGGVSGDADISGLNQARVLADGEQVRVPRVGDPPVAIAAAPGKSAAPAIPTAPVDLNRATPAELDILPGVGPATAVAIVAWREKNGRFRRIEDLLDVPGIGPARLERLRPMVRV